MKNAPLILQKAQIKADTMPNNRRVSHKLFQLLGNITKTRRIANFHIADACESGDKFWNMSAGVDEG